MFSFAPKPHMLLRYLWSICLAVFIVAGAAGSVYGQVVPPESDPACSVPALCPPEDPPDPADDIFGYIKFCSVNFSHPDCGGEGYFDSDGELIGDLSDLIPPEGQIDAVLNIFLNSTKDMHDRLLAIVLPLFVAGATLRYIWFTLGYLLYQRSGQVQSVKDVFAGTIRFTLLVGVCGLILANNPGNAIGVTILTAFEGFGTAMAGFDFSEVPYDRLSPSMMISLGWGMGDAIYLQTIESDMLAGSWYNWWTNYFSNVYWMVILSWFLCIFLFAFMAVYLSTVYLAGFLLIAVTPLAIALIPVPILNRISSGWFKAMFDVSLRLFVFYIITAFILLIPASATNLLPGFEESALAENAMYTVFELDAWIGLSSASSLISPSTSPDAYVMFLLVCSILTGFVVLFLFPKYLSRVLSEQLNFDFDRIV